MTDISAKSSAVLDCWYSQKPTVALMGEFSAGKSTLLNLILGQEVLPTQVTATNMPVFWLTYGDDVKVTGLTQSGVLENTEIDELSEWQSRDYQLIHMSLPSKILRKIDVIDTPGISDSRMAVGALNFLKPYLDLVVWCSAANQAWRQSEKAVWTTMPEPLRKKSILMLTRADTMRNTTDLEKVIRRCVSETEDLFAYVHPISTLVALQSTSEEGEIADIGGWQKSHADIFFRSLEREIDAAVSACEARPDVQMPGDDLDVGKDVVDTRDSVVTGAVASTHSLPVATADFDVDALKNDLRAARHEESHKSLLINTLEHHFTAFRCESEASDEHLLVFSRAMSLEQFCGENHRDAVDQLVREIEDFANKTWCRLDQIH